MKKILFLYLIILLSGCAASSLATVEINPISKEIQVPGNQNQIYVRANTWMVEKFRNAKSVIQFSDKEEGIIVGRYFLHNTVANISEPTEVFALIRIQVKDGTSRITISPDHYRTWTSSAIRSDLRYPEEQLREDINQLISDFESYMSTHTATW